MSSLHEIPKGIRRRGDRWFVDVTVSGLRRTATCATLEEAILAQARLRTELMNSVGADAQTLADDGTTHTAGARGGGWTLSKAVERCIADVWHDIPAASTQALYAEAAVKFFGKSFPIAAIDTEGGKNYVRHLRTVVGNKPATIAKKVSALRMVLKNAAEYKNSGIKEAPSLKAPKPKGGRIRFLSTEEETNVLGILRTWGKNDHADVVTVLIDTGLRPNELYHLQKRDVIKGQSKWGHLYITGKEGRGTKNGEFRAVPLSERAAQIVWARVKAAEKDTERLFPYHNGWMRNTWDSVRHHLGFDDDQQFVTYICRHTCASRLAMKGVPIPTIKSWLGHKTIQMTMRYAHLCPQALFNAVDALDGWNQGGAVDVDEEEIEE